MIAPNLSVTTHSVYSNVMHWSTCYDALAGKLQSTLLVPDQPSEDRKPAAVALILQPNGKGLELLLIERAHHPADPWSGNIGLPGGRRDPVDASLRHTAERETREEVGIDLTSARFFGRLSDVVGANLPVRVACFVYGLTTPVEMLLSHEVHDAFWYGLEELRMPERQVLAPVRFGERQLEAPAIDLGLPGKPVLWGITYRLVSQFRELLEAGEERQLPYELPL